MLSVLNRIPFVKTKREELKDNICKILKNANVRYSVVRDEKVLGLLTAKGIEYGKVPDVAKRVCEYKIYVAKNDYLKASYLLVRELCS